MIEILITLLVLAGVVYGVLAGWYTQALLVAAGFTLLLCGAWLGNSPIVPEAAPGDVAPTGYAVFDLFARLKGTFSYRSAGLGLNIMAVGGFARYMSKLGASEALVRISLAPLSRLRAPYLVLGLAYVIGALLNIFITSATGLGLLLMATMYPVLRGLGLSRLTAAGAIATTGALELGPTQTNVIYAAAQADLELTQYVFSYQLPVALPAVGVVAVLHGIWQRFMDARNEAAAEGQPAVPVPSADPPVSDPPMPDPPEPDPNFEAPWFYAALTMLPLVFVVAFSGITGAHYRMHIVTAILVGVFTSVVVHAVVTRSVKIGAASLESFMDGMGAVFASVVTLVVAAGIFADGLKQIGVIDLILTGARDAGLGPTGMTVVIVAVIAVSAVMMGSGNASFLSFGELVPNIAARFGVDAASMLLPMQLTSSLARTFSPITAVIIAVAGLAEVSPFALIRRTVVPMAGGIATVLVLTIVFF